MTSSDPAVRALGAAGTELQVAAAELSAAAALQSFGMKGILGRLGIALAPAAGALGLATVVSGGLPGADVPPELDTEAGRKKAEERSLAQYQLYVAKQQLAQIEANKKDVKRGDLSGNLSPRSGGQQIVPYAQAVSELNAKIAALSSSVDKLGGSSVLAPEMGGKNWIQQAVAAGVAAGMANKPPQWGDVPGATPKTKVPLPKPRPDVLDKSTSDNIVGAANTIQTSVSGFSSNFLAATSKLDGSASTFAGVFETGTQQFIAAGGQAGQQAVSAMSGGAAGIGNVIGTTAAAAMRAAVANLSINVNANVVGAANATADVRRSKSDLMSRTNCAIGKDYVPASFKGVGFVCTEASIEGGRRGAEGEFPFGEDTAYADLGRKIRVFNLTAVFREDDHVSDASALYAACESPGPGILVHPTKGTHMVACRSVKISDKVEEEQGETTAELEFVEANILGGSFAGSLFGIISSGLNATSQASFYRDYNPWGVSQPWTQDIITVTQSIVGATYQAAVRCMPADLASGQ